MSNIDVQGMTFIEQTYANVECPISMFKVDILCTLSECPISNIKKLHWYSLYKHNVWLYNVKLTLLSLLFLTYRLQDGLMFGWVNRGAIPGHLIVRVFGVFSGGVCLCVGLFEHKICTTCQLYYNTYYSPFRQYFDNNSTNKINLYIVTTHGVGINQLIIDLGGISTWTK